MRSRILCLLVVSLLAPVVHVPSAIASPAERIFNVGHTPPDEAYAELDLPLAVTVQSNCDDFDFFLGSYTCGDVQLTVFYRTVLGVETSRTVSGHDGTEPQQLVVVVPKEHLEIGQFAYYIEVHQTYCVFLGCTQPNGYEDFGRVRVPGTGEQHVAVPGAFPAAPSDNVVGIAIDNGVMKLNFQECGPRGGAALCTTADSRPTKFFSGAQRGALYYPCQGSAEQLDGTTLAGQCAYVGENNLQGLRDSTAKTRTVTLGPNCDGWNVRAGDLINAEMDAEFVQTMPGVSTQLTFLVSELFLNVFRQPGSADVWTLRNHATDPGNDNAWSYFVAVDKMNSARYLKMYLSGQVSSSSPIAVCANGDHIADLAITFSGVGFVIAE